MNQSPGPDGGILVGIFLLYGFIILLGLASFVFWIIELVDVARREFPDSNTKLLWVLVVALAHGLGALIYYFVGKPQGWLPGERPQSPYPPPGYAPPSVYPPPPAYPPPPSYGQSQYPPPPQDRQE